MCSVHDLTCEISAGFGLSNAKLSVSAISQFTDKCDSGRLPSARKLNAALSESHRFAFVHAFLKRMPCNFKSHVSIIVLLI